MATVKQKIVWYCKDCGHKAVKWLGQCPSCQAWNSFQDEVEVQGSKRLDTALPKAPSKPLRLSEISTEMAPRRAVNMPEFDRLLGGGLVQGSFTLVGGSPGIGKSTMMLQVASKLAEQGLLVLYICGEESVQQTSMRAARLNITSPNLLLFSETNLGLIKAQIDAIKPQVLIVDSVQIIYKDEIPSACGSVSQVREVASEFMHIAKGLSLTTFLIGHVTKSGEIAGPRVLEHLVDTVLYFEGDQQFNYRLVRVTKNRFGPTDEVAVFQMRSDGLAQVSNPSELFLEERSLDTAGSVIIPTVEGSRPILVELQALVTDTVYSTPSRRSTGLDPNRLALLLAVLEKRVGYQMHKCDVFVSVTGGLKIQEPAIDLGILLAIASSMLNRRLDSDVVVIGEVGLGGEVRSCSRVEARIKEAINMGFGRCIIPKRNLSNLPSDLAKKIQIETVELVEQAIDVVIR